MKITGEDFFYAFKELFQTIYEKSPDEILNKYKKRNPWTDLLLNDKKAFLPHVIYQLGNSELECKREFFGFDLCAWDNGRFYDNKPQYDKPLYLSVTIEHENGPNPEEEFWKLLHWYSPLKVLISHPSHVNTMIEHFNRIRKEVCSFHSRSPEDQYLIIFGTHPDQLHGIGVQWRGWLCVMADDVFNEIR